MIGPSLEVVRRRRPGGVLAAGVAIVLCLALAACVAGSGESHQAASGGELSGFLLGLWHGIIGPITLIGEIINHFAPHALPWTVKFHETVGVDWTYELGFYLGLVGSPVAAGSSWSRRD
jgi:hypothetical protein